MCHIVASRMCFPICVPPSLHLSTRVSVQQFVDLQRNSLWASFCVCLLEIFYSDFVKFLMNQLFYNNALLKSYFN